MTADVEKISKTVLAFLLCLIWIVVILVSLIASEYAVLIAISPVMLSVSGFLFSVKEKT